VEKPEQQNRLNELKIRPLTVSENFF